ncbi:fimbrial protein [Aeromonas dhakensis]|uniref:fimbrial protein n=1 Tax=Aeromonas dhakensis TaxID=196024 RepID=UPI00280D5FD7|nr:fimbrial protein [Aeromonas hydrophila]
MKISNPAALLMLLGVVDVEAFDSQRTIFRADVVSSACHVVVDVDGGSGGGLLFDAYHKSIKAPVPSREFAVQLYDSGASALGCSAFLAGRVATLAFGNPGQLDSGGVVTRGAGDAIRVDIRAIDSQADFRGPVTQGESQVNYPTSFASGGVFRFRAQPIIPKDVKVGEYHGALAFVISYQ